MYLCASYFTTPFRSPDALYRSGKRATHSTSTPFPLGPIKLSLFRVELNRTHLGRNFWIGPPDEGAYSEGIGELRIRSRQAGAQATIKKSTLISPSSAFPL